MRTPHVDDVVRLTKDIPELFLSRGEIGVVCSTWFSPVSALDVEFSRVGTDRQTRALVSLEQVELEEPQDAEIPGV
ncbi:DUF4926 domain-containing protein [Humisphaera borealis]|uniref:DUF4926 domain-containing protein n=1 Tax=Humisphaera borealis TaxID=2807512 RepID=A0A7M2WWW0_9BACT|nr:DUF4926 domain-containing protein [Humisphaera borealis]QOV89985.1 DUF4926 domain-containing protein [Humisphaera borealis]